MTHEVPYSADNIIYNVKKSAVKQMIYVICWSVSLFIYFKKGILFLAAGQYNPMHISKFRTPTHVLNINLTKCLTMW